MDFLMNIVLVDFVSLANPKYLTEYPQRIKYVLSYTIALFGFNLIDDILQLFT